MKKSTIKIVGVFLSGWIALSLMSFACRQDAQAESSPEQQAEIESIEAEVAEIEKTEQEIKKATARLDSLLNELK